jgi:hypothetical protein
MAAERTRRRWIRAIGCLGATLAAVTVWAVASAGFGVEVRAPAMGERPAHDVTAANVAAAAAVASLAGWCLAALLERVTVHARWAWAAIAGLVLVASLGAPLTGEGITTASSTVLVLLHLTVAGVLIPVVRRTSPDRQSSRAR